MLCTASFACGRYTYAYTYYDKQDTMQSIEIEGFMPFYEPAITRNKICMKIILTSYANLCDDFDFRVDLKDSKRKVYRDGNRVKNSLAVVLFSIDLSSCTRLTPKILIISALRRRVQEFRTYMDKIRASIDFTSLW